MRLTWLTDTHLDFVNKQLISGLCDWIMSTRPDAVLISGDIANGKKLRTSLTSLSDQTSAPIYFVLGNHDFYHGSIADVRVLVSGICAELPKLTYLTHTNAVHLTGNTCLIGHDGWADGRLGDYQNSHVRLNDYVMIRDLANLEKQERLNRLNTLGDEAAEHFRKTLPTAIENYNNIILLTHVPPFREACWHEGQISNDEYLPHFACKAAGDVIRDIMLRHPNKNMTILCGHTHSNGIVNILPNLRVKTGSAIYTRPSVQETIEIQ